MNPIKLCFNYVRGVTFFNVRTALLSLAYAGRRGSGRGPAWDGTALTGQRAQLTMRVKNWYTIVIENHPLTDVGGVAEVTFVQSSWGLRLLTAQGPVPGGPHQQPGRSRGMYQTETQHSSHTLC